VSFLTPDWKVALAGRRMGGHATREKARHFCRTFPPFLPTNRLQRVYEASSFIGAKTVHVNAFRYGCSGAFLL
jgi:hypothetical protein